MSSDPKKSPTPIITQHPKTGWFSIEWKGCALQIDKDAPDGYTWEHAIEGQRSWWQYHSMAEPVLKTVLERPGGLLIPNVNFDM